MKSKKREDGKPVAPESATPAQPIQEPTASAAPPEVTEVPELKPDDFAHRKRAAVLNEIAKSARERRDNELRAEGIEPEDTSAPVTEHEDEDDEEEQQPAATPTVATETQPAKRKFLVDGVEKEFSEEEIIAIVQKSATADKRLEEATRLREEAARKAASPQPVAPQPPPSAGSSPADVGTSAAPKELVAALTKAVMYGSEEEVAKAFEQALGYGRGQAQAAATQTQGMTPEQVQAFVMQQTAEATAFNAARSSLELPPEQGGFGDIWSEPKLQQMFIARESELRDAGDKRPYKELYAAIGGEIRQWRDNLVKAHMPKPITGLEGREARKATAVVLKGGNGKLPPSESKPRTRAEMLESMRAARGQARI